MHVTMLKHLLGVQVMIIERKQKVEGVLVVA